MKLYINKDIAADSEKMSYWMSGQDAVSYSDISAFLEYMREYAPSDNRIDVELHSCGGDCVEGYAIYDALRTSGKEISCCVVGQCASMATIILLAAPLERRTMYEHASMLIHEPYFPDGLKGKMTINKLGSIQADLQAEKDKMMSVYLERTGADAEVLNEQIARGDWFGVDKAIELGFISSVVPVASAKEDDTPQYSNTFEQENKEMKINEKSAVGKAFIALAKAVGVVEEEKPVGLTITDVNGNEIEIEREDGEIMVGDKTTAADGEYTLEDGRTIVVEGGEIIEIKQAETETEQEEETEENTELNELNARIAELEAQVAELTKNAKSDEENNILAMVEKAGGINALMKTTGNYNPAGRANSEKDANNNEMVKAIEEKRKSNAAFVPYWQRKK